jgi:hypothetical protein
VPGEASFHRDVEITPRQRVERDHGVEPPRDPHPFDRLGKGAHAAVIGAGIHGNPFAGDGLDEVAGSACGQQRDLVAPLHEMLADRHTIALLATEPLHDKDCERDFHQGYGLGFEMRDAQGEGGRLRNSLSMTKICAVGDTSDAPQFANASADPALVEKRAAASSPLAIARSA